MPQVWDDQKDLLRAFNENGVEYLVIGGHAVSHHTEPRTTKDLDLLIRDSEENSHAVYRALAAFGAPLGQISPSDFRDPNAVFQVGVEPSRVDILQSISGVETEEAWQRRVPAEITDDRIPTNFISAGDLLRAKLAAGRPQDLADAAKIAATQNAMGKHVLPHTKPDDAGAA